MPDSDQQKIQAFIKKIGDNPLPVLNPTVPKITEELGQEVFNYERLGQLVYLDPLCVFNFLAWANNHKQEIAPDSEEKIKTPKHAAMLLGTDNIDRCMKEFKPLSTLKNQAIANKLERLACRALHTAYQARNLARIMRSRAYETVYLSALMMPLAELLVWYAEPKKAQKVELLIIQEKQPETEAQIKIFGFTYIDLVITMAPLWHLPETFISALQTEVLGEAKKSILCIKLADKLARLIDYGWYHQQVYDFFEFCQEMTPFSSSRLNKEFHKIALQMAWEGNDYYQVILPAVYISLQEGKVPYQQVISLDTPKQPQNESELDSTIVRLNTQVAHKEQAGGPKNLESASNLPTLIQLTINSLHSSNRFFQTVFLMLDKNKSDLIVRMGKGLDDNAIMLQKINVSRQRNLFSILLEKPQSIFVKQAEFNRYEKFFSSEISNLLPATEFCAKALFYHNKPIGLFYVTGENQLLKEDYDFFRKTLVRFDQHLSKIS